MKVVIQRVSEARVLVDDRVVGAINKGLLILVGFHLNDQAGDMEWMVRKVSQLRVFSDRSGRMNLAVSDVEGDILLVSQFTLYASTRKGNRPSFTQAADPEKAQSMYLEFGRQLEKETTKKLQYGEFGAQMQVSLVNDGPVTIIIDSLLKS